MRFSASAAVEGTGMVEATDTTGRFLSVCANSTEFFTEEGEQKISFYVNGRKQPVLIRFSYTGAGEAQIREISLVRTREESFLSACLPAFYWQREWHI